MVGKGLIDAMSYPESILPMGVAVHCVRTWIRDTILCIILQCNGHQDAHSSHSLVVLY